ncbi:hypothetical protein NQ315_016815 [Exocentrus adspersus]|uniref:Phosphomevalonate kinase n=1 Tax=Exocentrus adspersus TaxID=1586481 RepID=A0AAV8VX48_9CUCU|nr:hypothetical protein NQ315_016815 [Exocentrus adspersus]
MGDPQLVLLFSGKRKSGKDYICEKIKSILVDKCTIVRISAPLKSCYAQTHALDLKELMSDGPYKEKYRLDMINWSDEVRKKDPGYFCKAACDNAALKPVWIVSDIRRKTDIEWFRETYGNKIKTIRITAEMKTRESRGWIFQSGVDDVASECDLDDWQQWDLEIENNDEQQCGKAVVEILKLVEGI